ncbi:hypothetical protein G7009_13565 [Pseudomonas capeferrum]|uniref:hypothetical protein n=1 Tax=Pseudomonas capeferrum TaxID=1495066 RepID=UPI0015E32DE7|nr:hypothetical protein [Pseudomonas capeferrum]MBA1202769.1 hypothetical protein [Pseudomonas capeferrum]
MRAFLISVAACLMTLVMSTVQARTLSTNDRQVCGWGAQIAAEAQRSKLSGVSLYTARKRLQNRKFPKPWMRMTAFGIVEQTYTSPSRLQPAAIRQVYNEQCVAHAVARR